MGYRTTDLKGVEGPASSTDNSLVLFDGTTGEKVKNQSTLTYDAGALILTGSGSAIRMGERAAAPGTSAGNGAFWVDDYVTYERPRFTPGTTTTDYYLVHTNSFSNTAIPYFSGVTAAVASNPFYLFNPTLRRMFFNEGGASLHIRGGASITTAPDANSGAYWVKDDGSPRFTNNAALEYNLRLGNNVSLGEWNFGNSTLGVTSSGTFDTDNATIPLITAIRFNAAPVAGTGQSMQSWADILPQNGILYLQDVANPGANSVTFPYTSITFPSGALFPQFNGPALATDGTSHGANWSANRYSLQIISIGDISGPASSTDNAMVRFDGTSGTLVQESVNTVGDNGNIILGPSAVAGPAIRFSIPTSPPTGASGTGWQYIGWSGTSAFPIFRDGGNIEHRLGIQEIRLIGALNAGLTQNQWYTWANPGHSSDALWDTSYSLGTGATPDLSAGAGAGAWHASGLYFPLGAHIVSVDVAYDYNDTTNAGTLEFNLRGIVVTDGATAPTVESSHATGSKVALAADAFYLVSLSVGDATVSAGEKLFFCFRRTTATAITTDPTVEVVIRYTTAT